MKRQVFFLIITLWCWGFVQAQKPNYADTYYWAYYETAADKSADVFLLCPTVDYGKNGQMNMALDDSVARYRFCGALNMERGIYDHNANLYAPFYRQATFAAYQADSVTATAALHLAYKDVRAAFKHYLSVSDKRRPLVLAGFSQGSDMLLRLMKDCFRKKSLQRRLVAAYAIGWRITDEDLRQYPYLKMAQGEFDTGVIVSFNSEAPGMETSMMVPKGTFTYAINPLNWRTDTVPADLTLNLGACFMNYDGTVKKEIPQLTGAYLDARRGTLIVTDVTPTDYPGIIFPNGIYHIYDYQFFYRNLQKNVKDRIRGMKGGPHSHSNLQ